MTTRRSASRSKAPPSYQHPEVFSTNWHWRTIFLFSIVLKTYFSLSPSYIHPDEHFQGPELLADHVLGWATKRTWETTIDTPVRSYFVAGIVYGLPMMFIETMFASSTIDPIRVLYCLRLVFALGSWILSDMAIDRLTRTKQHRLAALFFYATSYVSWTYQSHTFSNSVETVVLLWCLLIIHELQTKRPSWCHRLADASLLGALVSFGIFNRVSFPAFLIIPGLRILPWLLRNPMALVAMGFAFVITSIVAIYVDTVFYSVINNLDGATTTVTETITQFMDEANVMAAAPKDANLVITPLNLFLYNVDSSNLATHGLHSRFTHLFVNLPELMGPALILLISTKYLRSLPLQSALSGLVVLSLVPHQEGRFIIPVIPLLCCCLDFSILQKSKVCYKLFFAVWFVFNILMAGLMGMFHQGGIIPAQTFISSLTHNDQSLSVASGSLDLICIWWKTYSPPIWLLGKPVGTVEVLSPKPHREGDDAHRYEPMFQFLTNLEDTLETLPEFSAVDRPSKRLHLLPADLPAHTSQNDSGAVSSIAGNKNHHSRITVMDVMGAPRDILNELVYRLAVDSNQSNLRALIIAPIAAFQMNPNLGNRGASSSAPYTLNPLWSTRIHMSLDDLDFSDWLSLTPGLGVWEIST